MFKFVAVCFFALIALAAAKPRVFGETLAYTAPVAYSSPYVAQTAAYTAADPYVAAPLTSPYVASPYIASPYFASPYVAAPAAFL